MLNIFIGIWHRFFILPSFKPTWKMAFLFFLEKIENILFDFVIIPLILYFIPNESLIYGYIDHYQPYEEETHSQINETIKEINEPKLIEIESTGTLDSIDLNENDRFRYLEKETLMMMSAYSEPDLTKNIIRTPTPTPSVSSWEIVDNCDEIYC